MISADVYDDTPAGLDAKACEEALRQGSHSFSRAARLLPARVRIPITALYAFCRMADDVIDHGAVTHAAVDALRGRLDRIYTGRPMAHAEDRALARVVEQYRIPRRLLDALIEGFACEIERCRYETLDDLQSYAVRVAGTVGVMAATIMGRRDEETLSRACDLGVAMQLTNIARDVGEDARRRRLYLPRTWMREAGLDPDKWLANPTFSPELGGVVRRLLDEADRLYQRAESGIARLPADCRVAVQTARLVYADIGRVIEANGYDSVNQRAVTSGTRKTWLALRSSSIFLQASDPDRPTMETVTAGRFLIDAVAEYDERPGTSARLEAALERAVDRLTGADCPPRLARAIRYAVFPAGHRLRPRLCYAVAQALGHQSTPLLEPASIAIELLHCASLVQDDLPSFDNAAMRRGRPSVHRVFGESLAVLASDALIVGAFEELALAAGPLGSADRKTQVTRRLARAVGSRGGLVAGQGWEEESAADLAAYHGAKTAALFEASAAIGAIVAGGDPARWAPLGRWIGMAYQAADDFADHGDPAPDAVLGRPNLVNEVGHDRGRRVLKGYAQRALESIPPCAGREELRAHVVALLEYFETAAERPEAVSPKREPVAV